MSNARRAIGWVFVGGSLLMHVLTVWCYAEQPDAFAAFTVLPFWLWGGIGLLMSVFAFCFLRAPLSLIVTAVWAVTLSVGMDEAKALSNFGHPRIQPVRGETSEGRRPLRVLTVNCSSFAYGAPLEDLKKWNPDIVLLQEVFPHHVKRIAEGLYGGGGDYRAYLTNGVVTRYEIRREVRNPRMRYQQMTVRLPSGKEVEVVNLHLATAATDMRLWSKEARSTHRRNRALRRIELSVVLQVLEQTTSFPNTPTILGGDFNASATDVVHRQLIRDFEDTFSNAGRGWGNTFHRRFPIVRIDHLYTTRQFQAIACGVAVSMNTDHRMVVGDFILRE